ncbi:MAG: carboxymuconolactone decarboxylase family protein [Thermoleophilaceae bacterium]
MKAAMVAGCEFCLDIGSALARRGGVTEAQLRALATHADSEEFSEGACPAPAGSQRSE